MLICPTCGQTGMEIVQQTNQVGGILFLGRSFLNDIVFASVLMCGFLLLLFLWRWCSELTQYPAYFLTMKRRDPGNPTVSSHSKASTVFARSSIAYCEAKQNQRKKMWLSALSRLGQT